MSYASEPPLSRARRSSSRAASTGSRCWPRPGSWIIGAVLLFALPSTSARTASRTTASTACSIVAVVVGLLLCLAPHRPEGLGLAQPGVARHEPSRHQAEGILNKAMSDSSLEKINDAHAQPELDGPHLQLRHARHPHRGGGAGAHAGIERLPDARRSGALQDRDAQSEGAARSPRPRAATARPAARGDSRCTGARRCPRAPAPTG